LVTRCEGRRWSSGDDHEVVTEGDHEVDGAVKMTAKSSQKAKAAIIRGVVADVSVEIMHSRTGGTQSPRMEVKQTGSG
jgi:hypothetical protein